MCWHADAVVPARTGLEDQGQRGELVDHLFERRVHVLGIDILGRLIEIWSGKPFRDVLHERLFAPLGMVDTDFHVPEAKHDRLTTNYEPLDLRDNMKPGLKPCPDLLIGSVLAPKRFHSGGGGLVGTIGDYTRFIQMIANNGTWDGQRYLSPSAVELMHTNLLPPGVQVRLPVWKMPDTVFGAGFAIKNAPAEGEPASAATLPATRPMIISPCFQL